MEPLLNETHLEAVVKGRKGYFGGLLGEEVNYISRQSYVVAATRIISLNETSYWQFFLMLKHWYLKMLEPNRFDIVTSSKKAINRKPLPVFGEVFTNLVQFENMVSDSSHKTVV